MRQYLVGGFRFVVVSVGVIALTSLSLDATDLLQGSQSALGILTTDLTTESCPSDMVEVEMPDRSRLCVDEYEASAGSGCLYREPKSTIETAANANDPRCTVVSSANEVPWSQVLLVQAEQLCARVGKRLPTATEWYLVARGTPDSAQVCNTSAGPKPTGVMAACRSGDGVYDMVGGVWEWVVPTVDNGYLGEVPLPGEGYVSSVSENGLPRTSTSSPDLAYNSDYIWSLPEGQYGAMRGGFHGSRSDAGVYTLHGAVALDFAAPTVGFRCVKSLN